MPLSNATAKRVVKGLLDNIIPRFGLVENTDSENRSHFKVNIIKALSLKREHHSPWQPSSSGGVEKMIHTSKRQLTKIVLGTRLPWTKCLPLAWLRIRTAPQKDIGVSLYELLYGLPYLGWPLGLPSFETKDQFLQNSVLGLSSVLSSH
jgi:hypothetical protein